MRKYDNFCSALKNLEKIQTYQEPYDIVTLTGLVGLYEICFEQAWKLMKELLTEHGIAEGATSSPKMILKTAFQAGMIRDEELWLHALQQRNNIAHSYNENIALDIVRQTQEQFYPMFCELKTDLEEAWM